MKRIISIISIICVLLCSNGLFVFAQTLEASDKFAMNTSTSTVLYDDGSYCIITITESNNTRSTKISTKHYSYYNSDNVLQWKVTVSGTFTYNGTTSSCTSASHTVTISNDAWYISSQNSYKSGNQAIADVTMKKKILGIVTSTQNVSLELTCDKDGNLS